MIKYEWRREFDDSEVAELTGLLDRAARYDAEPEYTTIRIDDVLQSISRPDAHHLPIWMLPYATALAEKEHPERIAGLLRVLTRPDGTADAALVIEPELRSIGITTLFLERAGLDTAAPDGWLGTGARSISAWAQGNHPAAGRLGDRFLIPRTRRVWKLIRPLDGPQTTVLEPLAGELPDWAVEAGPQPLTLLEDGRVAGVLTLDLTPMQSEEFGTCATATGYRVAPDAPAEARRRLLDGAASAAFAAGMTGVIIHVESADTDWVHTCRLSGFQHDRTDVRFQLGDL